MSLIFEHVNYSYPGISTPALRDVSGTIEQGKITALVGGSGSGKSTLGMVLKGLLKMDNGTILQADAAGSNIPIRTQDLLMHVGWTPANPEIQLFASTVQAEVAFGPTNLGYTGDELKEKVVSAIETVGLDYDFFKNRHPLYLSGGEKRLVALAGVVAMGFKWYILDEPSVGLDYRGQQSVRRLASRLAESGAGVCWISHDLDGLKKVAQNVIELRDGNLEYSGAAANFDWDGCLDRMSSRIA